MPPQLPTYARRSGLRGTHPKKSLAENAIRLEGEDNPIHPSRRLSDVEAIWQEPGRIRAKWFPFGHYQKLAESESISNLRRRRAAAKTILKDFTINCLRNSLHRPLLLSVRVFGVLETGFWKALFESREEFSQTYFILHWCLRQPGTPSMSA